MEGGRHLGGWKNYPGMQQRQNAPVSFAWFFGVGARASSLSWGYDEPEILRYSNRQFGPIGADTGHFNQPGRQKPVRFVPRLPPRAA